MGTWAPIAEFHPPIHLQKFFLCSWNKSVSHVSCPIREESK
jgi:hypothetical protein